MAFATAGSSFARDLPIGVTPGAYSDSVAAAAEEAKARGLEVEVVEFSDWTTPNVALAASDIEKFVQIHQSSPKVRAAIGTAFADNPKLYTIAWEK